MSTQIWRCETCGKTYREYVNGCVEDHDPPGRVVLMMEVLESDDE